MPTVTVAGSGSNPIQYNTNDAYTYALNVANQLATAISQAGLVIQYTPGPANTVIGGSSVEVFSAAPAPATQALLMASNTIGVVDALTTPLVIQGGAAGVSVIAGSGGLTFTNITASGSRVDNIVAGDGANYIQTASVGGGNYTINTGAGNDTIVGLSGNSTINAGTGRNLVVLGGSASSGNNFVYSEGADSIVGNIVPTGSAGAGGTDTVFIGSGQTTVNPGSSNFFIYGNQFNALTVLRGVGSDSISVGAGGGSVLGGLAGNNYLFGGSGGAGSAGTTIQGGGNGDHLFAIGGGSITAIAGSGSETITGAVSPAGFGSSSSTGNNLFVAGSGNDSLQAGGGADTLQGGSGSAILTSGTGLDTFSFVNGSSGGSDTITGFKAADTLQLSGYGLNPATALNTSLSTNGGTILTLTDGTTITLNGVSTVSQTQIKAT